MTWSPVVWVVACISLFRISAATVKQVLYSSTVLIAQKNDSTSLVTEIDDAYGDARLAYIYHTEFPMPVGQRSTAPFLEFDLGCQLEVELRNGLLRRATSWHVSGHAYRDNAIMNGAYMISECGIPHGGTLSYSLFLTEPGVFIYRATLPDQPVFGLGGMLVVVDPTDPYIEVPSHNLLLQEAFPDPQALASFPSASGSSCLFQLDSSNPVLLEVSPNSILRIRVAVPTFGGLQGELFFEDHNITVLSLHQVVLSPPAAVASIHVFPGTTADILLSTKPDADVRVSRSYSITLRVQEPSSSFSCAGTLFYQSSQVSPAPPTPAPLSSLTPTLRFSDVRRLHAAAHTTIMPPTHELSFDLGMRARVPKSQPEDYDYFLGPSEQAFPPPFLLPDTPLVESAGECGLSAQTHITVLDAARDQVPQVRVVLNNLGRLDATLELHGMPFHVLATGYNDTEQALYQNIDTPSAAAPCASPKFSSPDHSTSERWDTEWGCVYDPADDQSRLNLEDPVSSHTLVVPRHSWAVIQFVADNPGFWLLESTIAAHAHRGQRTVFNVLPSRHQSAPEAWAKCPSHDCQAYTAAQIQLANERNMKESSVGLTGLFLSCALGLLVILSLMVYFNTRTLRADARSVLSADGISLLSSRHRTRNDYSSIN